MIALLSSPFLIGVCLLAFVLYLLKRAYPNPYPGIPYHLASAKQLWGDSPGLLAAIKHEPNKWVFDQNRNLGSPVAQLFLAPFSKPTIIIDDVREVKDILSNRTNVFDRAARTQDAYRDLLPHCSLVKLTTPAFKTQRRFWEGVTGTPFLRRIAEPKIYRCALGLVELFKAQAEMAGGRPFYCFDGFDVAAFELIWEVVFGTPENAINSARKDVLEAAPCTNQPASLDSTAVLPKIVKPYMCDTVSFFISTIAKSLRSVFPAWKLWYLRLQPAYKERLAWKINVINELIESTRVKLSELSEDQLVELEETSAVVTGVRRQLLAQMRQGGPGNTKFSILARDEIHDELFMLLVAGHETKAVLLSWTIKYLTANPDKQQKLRKALVDAFPKTEKGEQPSLKAMASTSIPYLDAYVEESIRVANTSPRFVRKTTADTQVLGYKIPKGATVFLNPYVGTQQFDVQETLRSPTSRNSKDSFDMYYDPKGMDDFQPERWLAEDGSFNPRQYPRLAFSAGPRMCYGRNLALMELRINLVLLVLNFNFEPVPEGLDSMESEQRLFRMPRQCYVRLSPL